MYRGSAYILLGRWIDAYDHIHVVRRKPRGRRKKAVSPFLSTFFWGGEGVPLFVIRPNDYVGSWDPQHTGTSVNFSASPRRLNVTFCETTLGILGPNVVVELSHTKKKVAFNTAVKIHTAHSGATQ